MWTRFREFKELDRLVRENPDCARLFDDRDIDKPVPWWQENHQGLANRKRRKLARLAYFEGEVTG
jgi:hypothetical protein